MKVIKQQDIKIGELIGELKLGKVIVYPTETCYGLGCDATNKGAVEKLFKIKQRQQSKPVLVLVDSVDNINKYVNWTPTLQSLAQKYWPGPLTVVADLNPGISLPEGVVGPDNSLAFRITSHSFASKICSALGVPLVSTSANITAHKSPYDMESVMNMFGDCKYKPDIVIDSGDLPHHQPSTVARVSGDKITVLRQGELVLNI